MARNRRISPSDHPLGAHMSIAGGVHLSIERGAKLGCRVIQIFSRNSNQWRARPLPPEEIRLFRRNARKLGVRPVAVHDSYLINLAAPERTLRRRSRDSLREEVDRAALLGVPYLVMHPGAHRGDGAQVGMERVADGLLEVLDRTKGKRVRILLETTAGQGTALGRSFAELASIIRLAGGHRRLGVCFDTCHVFAAGYDLRSERAYQATMRELDQTVGLRRLHLFHLNDSRGELGSHLDRHEHIGKGKLGRKAFRHLLNDPRFQDTPKLLETPKGENGAEDLRNLAVLRRLIKPRASS